MDDTRSVTLALREVCELIVPLGDEADAIVMEFVRAHLEAGTSRDIIVPLARLLLFSSRKAWPWAFFESIDALYELKMTTTDFAITIPESLRAQTARVLWRVRRRLRRFYVYPFLTLPFIVTILITLALFAPPVAVTVAVAIGTATLAATAVIAQLVNQHVRELDEITSTLKGALPSALQPALSAGAVS